MAIARAGVRIELTLAFAATAAPLFLFLALPTCSCPMYRNPEPPPFPWLVVVGAIGLVFGWAWMLHIRYTGQRTALGATGAHTEAQENAPPVHRVARSILLDGRILADRQGGTELGGAPPARRSDLPVAPPGRR